MAGSVYEEGELDEIAAKEPLEQPYLRTLLNVSDVFSQQWKQTSTADAPQIKNKVHRKHLAKVLIAHCRDIRLDPYNPKAWIERGFHFIALGYGELAVSDGYKARLLLDLSLGIVYPEVAHPVLYKDGLRYKIRTALANIIKKAHAGTTRASEDDVVVLAISLQQQALMVMASALISVRAYNDAIQVLDEASILCTRPGRLHDLRSQAEAELRLMEQSLQAQKHSPYYIQQSMKQGRVGRAAYPWISPEELRRSTKAVKKIKAKFETASVNKNAILGPSTVGGVTDDNFGVFARKDIVRDELIVIDKSAFTAFNIHSKGSCWACAQPLSHDRVSMACCGAEFCSEPCETEATKTYHQSLCGKDFRWLYEASIDAQQQSSDMIPLLLMKVLATAVQQNASPLKVACVGTLKVGYQKLIWSIFKFHDNIVAPVRILQTLGVDVFKDMRFDAWALQTLILRIENNMDDIKLGGLMYSSIRPLFSMFNHDCDPSADWSADHLGGPVLVTSKRDIKKGEEVTVSYVLNGQPEIDRRASLIAQIGMICECVRCQAERKAAPEQEAPPNLEFLHTLSGSISQHSSFGKVVDSLRDQLPSM